MKSLAHDWMPRLSADGVYYCSPACGGGKFCTKADYDQAVQRADELAAAMGDGWSTEVWENLGWHYCVTNGCIKIHADHHEGEVKYSAWIEPGFTVGRASFQIIEAAADPHEALGRAKQRAWDAIHRIRAAMTDLKDVVGPSAVRTAKGGAA